MYHTVYPFVTWILYSMLLARFIWNEAKVPIFPSFFFLAPQVILFGNQSSE